MTASLKDMHLDLALRSLGRALLWSLAGFATVVVMLLTLLAWSGILVW